MAEFKKGDRVLVKAGRTSLYGRTPKPGVHVVTHNDMEYYRYDGADEGEPVKGSGVEIRHEDSPLGQHLIFRPDDLLPFTTDPEPTPPSWEDVQVGDTVTVRSRVTGEEVQTLAYATRDNWNGPLVLGHDVNSRYTWEDHFELLSITKAKKPKKPLPTDLGAVIKVTAWGTADDYHPHLHLIGSRWMWGSGVRASTRTLSEIVSWERVL